MTFEELKNIVNSISYRPGIEIAVMDLDSIFMKDRAQIKFYALLPDAHSRDGKLTSLTSAIGIYYKDATEDQVVNEIYKQLVSLETHEAGEWFLYKGERIHDPHKDEKRTLSPDMAERLEKLLAAL